MCVYARAARVHACICHVCVHVRMCACVCTYVICVCACVYVVCEWVEDMLLTKMSLCFVGNTDNYKTLSL